MALGSQTDGGVKRGACPFTSSRGEGPFEQAGRTVDQVRAGQQCSDRQDARSHRALLALADEVIE
jgi:hypothetical protein